MSTVQPAVRQVGEAQGAVGTVRATYRLQLTGAFDFERARATVPYLRELGISHLYLSPIMRARKGSSHGYDVTDPTAISEELGGEQAFRRLAHAVHEAGMGVIVDFVPNHMAVSDENRYWSDPQLRRKFFDVEPRGKWHRRFFTIDDLAGVRVEDPEVFEETHRTILALVREGLVDGLRIDHIDGLADPAGYLRRLRDRGVRLVWVEKILELGEQLRDWPVQGTTGYEFANDATALFIDPDGEQPLTDLYAELTGSRETFEQVAAQAKLEQTDGPFSPEITKLRSLYDHPQLEVAVSSLPVYRTYVQPYEDAVAQADRELLASLPEELRRVLTLEQPGHEEFVVRFQQTTSAVMAKGVEDTAFYRYLRLVALNEVGGNPGRFSIRADAFHRANLERAERLPRQLLASQTHDTKRSGDVRARIGALASFAQEWATLVRLWRECNVALRDGPGPDVNEEYMIYQTLIGSWPIGRERITAYLEKALREAGINTGWAQRNEGWERSVLAFASGLYEHEPFLSTFEPFAGKVVIAGDNAALGALLLRLTSPGVPDIYQGDELWSLELVDPDNRRPVDWDGLHDALRIVARAETEIHDGPLVDRGVVGEGAQPLHHTRKLHLIHQVLSLRARRPKPFAGAYEPLPAPADVCAFTRAGEIAVAVGLRPDSAVEAVALPGSGWRELLADPAGTAPIRLLERG